MVRDQGRLGNRTLHRARHPGAARQTHRVDVFHRANAHGPHGGQGRAPAKKAGKLTIYHSAVTREQAQRGELFYALKHAFNGALTPMVQCLLDSHDLNAEEFAKIEAVIKARKKSGKGH